MSFLLGKDMVNRSSVELPVEAFQNHFMVLGASGSGKTVLCKCVMEEAVRNDIPVIIVDTQGDISSLALKGKPEEIERHGTPLSIQKEFFEKARVAIFTPASSKGIPISVNPLKFPSEDTPREDAILALDMTATSLTSFLGYNLDSDAGKEAKVYLFTILEHLWREGQTINDMGHMADIVLSPPAKIIRTLQNLVTKKRPQEIARKLRFLTKGTPSLMFQMGAHVDIDMFMDRSDGKVPVNIIYLNTLISENDKQFFLATLLRELYCWMLKNPSENVQMLFYVDEISPYIPPKTNPPPKKPFMLLFKQARKYGIGIVAATQNVTDVDYKALAQVKTWCLGCMRTIQDIKKVKIIVQSINPKQADMVRKKLPSLQPCELFLLSPDFYDKVVDFKVRWLVTDHSTLNEKDIPKCLSHKSKAFFQRYLMKRPVLPEPESLSVIREIFKGEEAHISEVNSKTLYKVAKDSNFLENGEDFQQQRERLLYFDEQTANERIKELVDSLTPQKIVAITGVPAVGKSTFMLYFLERCFENSLGDWRKIFFLNPSREYLNRVLDSGIIEKKINPREFSPDDILLVIDGLYREDRKEEEKAYRLFREVREKGYRLLITIHDHELRILKRKLGGRWREFENDIIPVKLKPDIKMVKPVLMNLVREQKARFDRFRELSDQEMNDFFKKEEFNDIVKIVREKSKGLIGYVKYLIDDLSKLGEFSKESIKKYPDELTKLFGKIIARDYWVEHDEVLPTIILLLAQKDFLSLEFVKSFIEWGVMEIDRASRKESQTLKSELLNNAVNLVGSCAVDTKEKDISLFRLKSHWKDAINRFSRTSMEWREIKKHLRPRLVTFLSQKRGELMRGELSPGSSNDGFVVVADVARLSKGLEFERKILKLSNSFLKEHLKYKDNTSQYLFLKRRITLLWINDAEKKKASKNYPKALESIIEGLELEQKNAHLNYLASICHRMMGNPSASLKYCEKALESYPANIAYINEMGNALELKGENLYEEGNFSLAIATLGEAVQSYKKAVTIIKNLNPAERGTKKREESKLRWGVGRCNKRIAMIQTKLDYVNIKDLKENAKKLLEKGKCYEKKGNYDQALEAFKVAKDSILEYCNITDLDMESEEFRGLHRLTSEIYNHAGICYEEMGKYENAARNYLIYADLNEYDADSFERYMKHGNNFRNWGLYAMAGHSFRRALRKDPNNYHALTELADVESKIGRVEFAIDHVGRALERVGHIVGVQHSNIDLLSWYEKILNKLNKREDVGDKLMRIIILSVTEDVARKLSNEWYKAGMSLDKINPKDIVDPKNIHDPRWIDEVREEIENAKVLCLWRAERILRGRNYEAIDEIMNVTGRPIEVVEEECLRKYQEYFRKVKKGINPLEGKMKSPVSEILHHICFRAISTGIFKYNKKTNQFRSKRHEKHWRKTISGNWGWLGGRIRKINRDDKNVIKISPKVAAKCFELSLGFNKRNKGSSNGYAWALFDAKEYDSARIAFENDMKLKDPYNPNLKNPASITGIGMLYMRKGEIRLALENLKKGAELRFKFRYEEFPERVLKQLRETAENLKELASISSDLEKDILKEALEIYEMIDRVIAETEVKSEQLEKERLYKDHQNLFALESFTLRENLVCA